MKKILKHIFAFFAIFLTFSVSAMNVNSLENLSKDNFSSFNGEDYDQFSSFEGSGLKAIMDTSRIFTISIALGAIRTGAAICLTPGLDYGMGAASVNGCLYDTGSIKDTAGNVLASIAVTPSPKPLYWLYSYLNDNPTLINMIKVYSTSSSAQCSTALIYKEQSPFQDLPSQIIPLAQNQNEMATRSTVAQVNLLPYLVFGSMQSQLTLPLYGSATDTTTIELYFAKTNNISAQLKQQVNGTLEAYPELSMTGTMQKLVAPTFSAKQIAGNRS